MRNGIKNFASNRDIDNTVTGNLGMNRCLLFRCEHFFSRLGFCHQHTAVGMRQKRATGLINDPAVKALIKIVAAQLTVATGGEHLKNAFAQTKDRDVKSSAA